MDSNRLWVLVGKKLSGEASALELEQLESFLASGFDEIYPVEELEKYWLENSQTPPEAVKAFLDKKWNKFERELEGQEPDEQELDEQDKPKLKNYNWVSAAAIVAILISVGIIFFKPAPKSEAGRINEIFAPSRGISKITLPDGTHVWLNSKSKLTYANTYGDVLREVNLEGEAYFDVVKDKEHPFIVKTKSITLKVLGTAFNVRSYLDEELTEASLVHGSIQVNLVNSSEKEIILKPSEKLIINNKVSAAQHSGKESKREPLPFMTLSYIHKSVNDSLPSEALWLENKLAFDSEPFSQVAKRFERWYGIEIKISNQELLTREFTGKFKDESLSEALNALRFTYPFDFKITKNQVIIF